ncbi:putative surface anchored protein [Pedobacter sp. CG_S7]|uniref:carboxypeptidase-like regulatory domain-containing protein n=1 Tax=Pedobacter sp. CG_S7 TaxID=3143930 RepID=UPI00339470C8
MKLFFVLIIFLFSLLNIVSKPAYAQDAATITTNTSGSIKGIAIDSATKNAVDYMTIALKLDNVVIKTMVTKSNGVFRFDKLAPGKYMVTAIAIGYNAKNVAVDITFEKNDADLGNIIVATQVNNLKEVSISGDRPIIKQEVDRISYDIQADPESKVLTVLDMMRKVPLLSLDADDNIKLKGS